MNLELKKIIDKAYFIFSKYTVSKPIDACIDCCVMEDEEQHLIETPIKKIDRDILAIYQNAAQPKTLNLEETKYFLPRFLELIAELNYPSHSVELSLTRIGHFPKENWTEEEWELLNEFMIVFFNHYLAIYPPNNRESIDSIFVMFDAANLDTTILRKEWENNICLESIFHFSDIIIYNDFYNAFATKAFIQEMTDWMNCKLVLLKFSNCIEDIIMKSTKNDSFTLGRHNFSYNLDMCYDMIQNKLAQIQN